MKNYFIIIRGPAGGGKTTIGKKLAEQLKAVYVSFDKILKENKLDYNPGEECVPKDRCLKGNKIMLALIIKKFNKGKTIVIEGNFYHKSQIEDLVKRLPEKPFIFTLKANISLCLKRDKTRNPLGEEGIKAVHKLVSSFDYGIIINTNNKNVKETTKEITSYLPT